MASNAKNIAELLNNQSTIATADIADDAITTAKISNDAVGADQLADNSVGTANITSGAISTAKVADGAVTQVKTTGVGAHDNAVINGAMQVAQRGTSSTGLGAANGYFTCDRYRHVFSGTAGRITSSQSTDAPVGFGNSLKFECTTADTSIAASEYFFFSQKIEGRNLQHFAKGTSSAKAFAVSFYVKGNAAATYALELYDADNNRQCSKSFNVTTSWNRVELIFPADTTGAFGNDNAESLVLSWWLHAGTTFTSGTLNSSAFASNTNANRALSTTSFFDSTNRTFFITGVKLEPVQVTDYVHRSFSEELRQCQRYLEVRGTNGSWEFIGDAGMWYSTTGYQLAIRFNEQMRIAPTMSYTGTISNYKMVRDAGTHACGSAVAADNTNGRTMLIYGSVANPGGSAPDGEQTRMQTNTAGHFFRFDAEL